MVCTVANEEEDEGLVAEKSCDWSQVWVLCGGHVSERHLSQRRGDFRLFLKNWMAHSKTWLPQKKLKNTTLNSNWLNQKWTLCQSTWPCLQNDCNQGYHHRAKHWALFMKHEQLISCKHHLYKLLHSDIKLDLLNDSYRNWFCLCFLQEVETKSYNPFPYISLLQYDTNVFVKANLNTALNDPRIIATDTENQTCRN